MTSETMTAEDYNALAAEQKRSKYGNRKTVVDGVTFDSAAEARRYGELRLMEQAGEIAGLVLQPRYPLMVNGERVAVFVGDFAYFEDGQMVVEDVKGVRTPVYRLKKKLMAACHGIAIKETE